MSKQTWVCTDTVVYDQHGDRIADCDFGVEGDEQRARLIAAAPDLLEALEAFLRAPSVGSSGPSSSTIVVQDFNLRAARAALAKAKGEAA